MKLHKVNGLSLVEGDCVEALARFQPNRFDSVVTDGPYGLAFMGKVWDGADAPVFSVEFWRAVLRVLKPGGHLLSFGGTRTYHRMTCAIEDAGFEIRDSLHWFYGTGFPKSLNVAKAVATGGSPEAIRRAAMGDAYEPSGRGRVNYDHGNASAMNGVSVNVGGDLAGLGTALKPGHEPIVLARKPLDGTVAANVVKWGTGGLNIDACRLATNEDRARKNSGRKGHGGVLGNSDTYDSESHAAGRWPANVLLDEAAAAELDAQSGVRAGGQAPANRRGIGFTENGGGTNAGTHGVAVNYDSGGASRFFKVIKCDEPASGADLSSKGEPHRVAGSAQSPARASASPGTSTQPASTNETPSGSKKRCACGTPTIPSSESECWPEPPPARLSPSRCHVCGAEPREPIATTRTTIDPSTLSESAGAVTSGNTSQSSEHGDPAYRSAFRYVAKPSRSERDLGCEALPAKTGGEATERTDGSAGVANPRAGANRGGGARNTHPTIKPIALMRYLVRLITPPGGNVLDPFTGSGTTGIAAKLEGRGFLGIEREPEYVRIALARMAAAGRVSEAA